MKLTDREWKAFMPESLFQECAIRSADKLVKFDLNEQDDIPVYSAQTERDGIVGFTATRPTFRLTSEKPIFVVFGEHTKKFHLAKHSFSVSNNVKVLDPTIKNEWVLLFIITVWERAVPDLGYATHWRAAKRTPIMLPVTDAGEPDYDFMEQYIKDLMLQKYFQYMIF